MNHLRATIRPSASDPVSGIADKDASMQALTQAGRAINYNWTKTVPGNPIPEPPGGWALPLGGKGPRFEQAMDAMREDGEMKLPRDGTKERRLHELGYDEDAMPEMRASAEREYEAYRTGRKEGKQP